MLPLSFYTIIGLLESTERIAAQSMPQAPSGKCAEESGEALKMLSSLRESLLKSESELCRKFNLQSTHKGLSPLALTDFRTEMSLVAGDLVKTTHSLTATNRWLGERLLDILRLIASVLTETGKDEGGGDGESPSSWPPSYSSGSTSRSKK